MPYPTIEEWAEKKSWFTLGTVEVPRQTRNLEPSEESTTASTTEAEHDTSLLTSKKTLKRDSWWNNQPGALINAWKENFYEIEIYRQPSAWLKVKAAVDNHGPEKSVKQIKAKLGRLKDAYKQVKDNNSRTGAAPQSRPYYNDFNWLLGERDIVSFKQVKEVVGSKNANLPTSPEGKVHVFGKKVSVSLCNLVALKCSSMWYLQKALSFESSLWEVLLKNLK